MTELSKSRWKKLLILPPLLIGIAVLALVSNKAPAPEQAPPGETATNVRVIDVPEVTLVPRALGYGNVQPGTVWEAVAEVSGQVVEIHRQLKKGAILGKGEVLVRIDPTQYELAIAQIQASIRSVQAQLAELEVKGSNTRASLEIDQRSLDLSLKDLGRKRKLLVNKTVAQAAVDEEERNVLARRQTMQSLKNVLNLIPTERQALAAQLALNQAQLEAARLDLERTTITAPFDCRIAEVNVERTQYASQGKVLAVADSIDVSEVAAQVPLGKLINLIPRGGKVPFHAAAIMENLPQLLSLTAVVRLGSGAVNAEWQARFTRISDTIDPKTRTVGIIVAVDDPYRQAVPGVRPPLSKNMFVEVELRGRPRPNQLVAPRAALHGEQVYVVNGENRLEKRAVKIAFEQTNFAVIESGIKAGERIVVSDPIPAIDGMKLEPTNDEQALRALIAEAGGEGTVK